jgi:hypothetical protein
MTNIERFGARDVCTFHKRSPRTPSGICLEYLWPLLIDGCL